MDVDVGTINSARAYPASTLKDQTRVGLGGIFLGEALSERARDRIG